MKKCARRKRIWVFIAFVLLFFIVLSSYSIFAILTKDTAYSAVGTTVVTEYGPLIVDEKQLYFSALLVTGTTIYVLMHIAKTKSSKILYDDYKVIFFLPDHEERIFSWDEIKPPDVRVQRGDTDPDILCFVFEDKNQLVISWAFKGYRDFCRMMNEKGVLDPFE